MGVGGDSGDLAGQQKPSVVPAFEPEKLSLPSS